MKRAVAVMAILMAGSLVLGAGVVQAAPLEVREVRASSDDGNVAANTLDGNMETRWSARGFFQWIRYELVACTTVRMIKIAWYQGDSRQAFFDVETSETGYDWFLVWSGQSTGTTTDFETTDIDDSYACYVRVVGYGNNSLSPSIAPWTSITEVVMDGDPGGDDQIREPTVQVPYQALQEICAPLLQSQP